MPLNDDGLHIIISGDGSQAINEINRVSKSLNALLAFQAGTALENTFGSVFKGILAAVERIGSALAGVARRALAFGGGFESQMTTVSVISGATAEELAQLTAKAREMGATLPISAKDAAMAMTVLAQRGTSAKDILASVADVANLTISQGVSMGQAADLLGSTITNFGLKIEDASKITAIFNNASNQSALNMGKLTEALKYVGPTAGSIGMGLTEAVAAMETLANAGLTGEMTGTGLAMVLTKLSTKSRIMGVETRDLQGKMRPLSEIFSELQAKGFSLAEATAAFGARGRLAALNLAKQSASLKENEERLKNWGSTQAAVDSKAKTFTNTMAAFRSAVEELHIEIFDQIKDKAKGVVGTFAELTRTFAAWVGQSKIAQKALQAFLEGLGFNIPAADDFKKLLDKFNVQAFVDRVRDFGKAIQGIAGSIASFADKVKTPLLFLIEHIDTFATISFWGWILGKGMQIPAIIISIAGAFQQLYSVLKSLTVINLAKLSTFLFSPVGTVVAGAGVALYAANKKSQAEEALRVAKERERDYMLEQARADASLDFDIRFNLKTGFEKLPQSWTKASDELRAKANETVEELRAAFKDKVAGAIEAVASKFPDMADAVKEAADNMSFSSLSQLTKALQGNKEAFDALPPHMQKVAEQLYITGVQAGQTEGSLRKIIKATQDAQRQLNSAQFPQQSDFSVFAQELSASLYDITASLPDNIERLQKFLSSENIDLAVNLSIEQAQAQLQQLSKSVAEKFNLPADIVNSELFSRLQILANKGNDTALSLVNGWKGAGNSLDTFLASAQEAISYLGASPDKFMPALNSLSASIQKFDPLTGKVTEQFKKAHDALKQWANVTFDQLAQRIQRLRKAVEGGFIDQSALEAEFKRASQQVKLQIATELQPSRSQFNSREAFNSVVASEYVSRMGELGGDAFMNLVQREFQGLYDKSGSAIGAAIMHEVNKGLASGNASIKINGIEMLKQDAPSNGAIDYSNLQKVFSDAVNPFVAKLEQFTQKHDNNSPAYLQNAVDALLKLTAAIDNSSAIIGRVNEAMLSFANSVSNTSETTSGNSTVKDYSPDFSNVVKELQSVSAGVAALQSSAQDNVAAVNSLAGALDMSALSQAVLSGFNPVVSRLDVQADMSAYVARNLEALIRSTDNYSLALASLQSSIASSSSSGTSSESFSGALAPLVSSVGTLASSVSDLQSINQNINSAVRDIENAVKSLSAGNNYDIDIIQQGFSVEKKSDADLVARNVASALRSGLGNGGV